MPSKVVLLNVGGRSFAISRATFEKHSESLLAKLVSDSPPEDLCSLDGALFLDLDPGCLASVLHWLRYEELPERVTASLIKDAAFYGREALRQQALTALDSELESKAATLLAFTTLPKLACGSWCPQYPRPNMPPNWF